MIVIHIGLKKSGSSSIQAFLKANEDALQGLSVDYPPTGRAARAHHNLALEIQQRTRFDPALGGVSDLAGRWRASKSGTMMLSSEVFEESRENQIESLSKKLRQARKKEEFRILMIVRDLIDLLPSGYAQRVKYGDHVHEFDEYFDTRMRRKRADLFDIARKWATSFGWEGLRIRVLDRKYLVNGDLIDELLTLLGIEAGSAQATALERPGIVNATPGWRVLEAVRALYRGRHGLPENHPLVVAAGQNGRMNGLGKRSMEVGDRFDWNRDRGRYLTREQAQQCLDVYRSSIESLNARLPVALPLPRDLDSRGFEARSVMPDAAQIPRAELQEFYDELWSLLAKRPRDTRRRVRRNRATADASPKDS